jgi:uncharacterized protein YegP (UPF0339 family)
MENDRFEMYLSGTEYRFRLVIEGDIRLKSEGYKEKASCLNGIASVKRNAPSEERYQRVQAGDGTCYFNLRAPNHEIIATSQMFPTDQRREQEILKIKTRVGAAGIDDKTEASAPAPVPEDEKRGAPPAPEGEAQAPPPAPEDNPQ